MTPVRRMWQEFSAVKLQLWVSTFLSAAATVSSIALLGSSGWLIARASQMPPILDLSVAIVAVRTFALTRSVARYSERLVSHDATFKTLTTIRITAYAALERLAPSGLAVFRRGDLMSRLVADVDDMQDLSLRVYLPIASSVVAATLTIVGATAIYPASGVALGLCLLVSATVVPWLALRITSASESAVAEIRGNFTEDLVDFFEGQADLVMLDANHQAIAHLYATDQRFASTAMNFARSSATVNAMNALLQGVAVVSSTWLATTAVRTQGLNPVLVIVIGLLPLAAFEAVASLPLSAMTLSRVRGSAKRICDILDAEAVLMHDPTGIAPTGRDISLNDIGARWPRNDHVAIENITLNLAAGSSVGLVGESGSGKSTIASVLVKFLVSETGTYGLGEANTADISGEQIRSIVGMSAQESHIFATSVRENLMLACPNNRQPEISDETLISALEQAQLGDWFSQLPQGLETVLGERGVDISAGQRQRILIARMFIAHPDIWILDEPTEHLNSSLADKVMAIVRSATRESSLIVASHRFLDTSDFASVIVLSGGHLELQAPPNQLEQDYEPYRVQLMHERQASAKLEPL